jgi:hypothetical protein
MRSADTAYISWDKLIGIRFKVESRGLRVEGVRPMIERLAISTT